MLVGVIIHGKKILLYKPDGESTHSIFVTT